MRQTVQVYELTPHDMDQDLSDLRGCHVLKLYISDYSARKDAPEGSWYYTYIFLAALVMYDHVLYSLS